MYLSNVSSILSVYTHMFGICYDCIEEAWGYQRKLVGHKAIAKMSPLGRKWLRSCSIKMKRCFMKCKYFYTVFPCILKKYT